MKIITRQEFLKLPANTLFHKYQPDVYGDLQIKVCNPDDGWKPDFVVDYFYGFYGSDGDLAPISEHFKFETDATQRDGLFDENDLYAVYDNDDIDVLIAKISKCKILQ